MVERAAEQAAEVAAAAPVEEEAFEAAAHR